ncbi:MAG: dienelactone hydrolase family protein [Lautropia sp.]
MSERHDPRSHWLELPPISAQAAPRLLIFLHGAGSTPDVFLPIAYRWQLKFPGATAVLMQGFAAATGIDGYDWFDGSGTATDRRQRIEDAALQLADRILLAQARSGIGAARTVVIGFSQGATLALQLARSRPDLAAIVVSYAGQLARPIVSGEQVSATVHLIHGALDTLVTSVHAVRAHRGLRAIGADVTLDIAEDGSHTLDRQMIIIGTSRVMQTVFRGRRRPRASFAPASQQLH